jgi:hypothetical protein
MNISGNKWAHSSKKPNDLELVHGLQFCCFDFAQKDLSFAQKASLTPNGLRGAFSKKHSKTAVSSSRSPTEFFFTYLHF